MPKLPKVGLPPAPSLGPVRGMPRCACHYQNHSGPVPQRQQCDHCPASTRAHWAPPVSHWAPPDSRRGHCWRGWGGEGAKHRPTPGHAHQASIAPRQQCTVASPGCTHQHASAGWDSTSPPARNAADFRYGTSPDSVIDNLWLDSTTATIDSGGFVGSALVWFCFMMVGVGISQIWAEGHQRPFG
jgi:hypothetical protein